MSHPIANVALALLCALLCWWAERERGDYLDEYEQSFDRGFDLAVYDEELRHLGRLALDDEGPQCLLCGKRSIDRDIDGEWWPPCDHAAKHGLQTLVYPRR